MRATLSALAILAFALSAASADDVLAIRAGRIIPVSGPDIENGIIIVRDGRIESVGKDIEIPWDARVIDASKSVVMPGWIEAHTWRGMDRPNEQMSSVPYASAFDSINPADLAFEDALRQGITTLLVSPGNQTLVGGQGCLVKPVGLTTEEMTILRTLGLKLSLQPAGNTSRMAHLAALRRELEDMQERIKEMDERRSEVPVGAKPAAAPAQEMDARKETMSALLKGKLTAFVYCPAPADVLRAIELSKQYKFKMTLVLGRDCWKAAEAIAREKLDVILPPEMIYWETDEDLHEEVLRVLPTLFSKAGVRFAFQTDLSSLGSSYQWYQAAAAVKHGLPRETAIKAGTLHAAEILGVADRLGSIEKGKWANLLVLTGDPLDAMSWVDQVVIEGKVVYERSKDERLKRMLSTKSE